MFTVISFAAALLAAIAVVLPLFSVDADGCVAGNDAEFQARADHAQRCAQMLADLDLDFAMGKVAQSDYERTKESLERELKGLKPEVLHS
jgi:hypothetical protein